MKSNQPIFVKIIAIVILVSALWMMFSIILNFTLAVSQGSLTKDLSAEELEMFKYKFAGNGWEFSESSLILIIGFGVLLGLAFGVFELIVGIKVWQGRNWARVVTIVFAFIIAFGSLISIFTNSLWNLIDFVVTIVIAVYLLVSRDAKRYFKKKRQS